MIFCSISFYAYPIPISYLCPREVVLSVIPYFLDPQNLLDWLYQLNVALKHKALPFIPKSNQHFQLLLYLIFLKTSQIDSKGGKKKTKTKNHKTLHLLPEGMNPTVYLRHSLTLKLYQINVIFFSHVLCNINAQKRG